MPPSPRLRTQPDTTARRRILEGLRSQILAGNFEPGSRMPSVRELAATWKASVFTLQTVMGALSREGWLELRHGSGTFIANPQKRFTCAAIYQSWDLAESGTNAFLRNLHFALLNSLRKLGKETQVFIDSRPDERQGKLMPELAEAIRARRVQCVLAPTTNQFNAKSLANLAIPVAFLSNDLSPSRVGHTPADMLAEGARRLAARGCRSVGIMSSIIEPRKDPALTGYYSRFASAAQQAGLVVRPEWIRRPKVGVRDYELHGYREFKKFWKLPRKPDGLMVFPDVTVKGIILAVLEIGISEVTRRMKFLFHRNAHVPILCPFQAIWAIADEDELANALLQLIQDQLRGKAVEPLELPFRFTEERSLN